MAKPPLIFTPTLTLLLLLSLSLLQASANPDLTSLLNFKSAADPLNHLKSWTPTTSPCTWPGISCLPNSSRVSHLILENLNLHGPSSSLTHLSSLTQLRVLSLNHNNLSGPLPSNSFSNFTALKLLFLSHNNFSGPFPLSILSHSRLYRLDLSCNSFSGPIPFDKLSTFTPHLLTLRLQNNQFSGVISGLNLSTIQEFNVSNNQLTGQIPAPLSGFPRSVFAQNPGLCGFPLQACKGSGSDVSDPTQPGGPRTQTPSTTVSSSPSSLPMSTNYTKPQRPAKNKKSREGGLGTLSIVAIVLGDIIILALVCTLLFCYFLKRTQESGKRSKLMESTEKIVYSSSPYGAQNGNQCGAFSERGRMVFFEGAKRFELEDLLRASAEMLGKGGFGTAYKAVLDDGSVVAVKRLKDGGGGKREFEQNMEVLGRLRHPNLVAWKAYYFAREEKLLVYDYMPNGSLFWLLHGNRGPGRTPLDWTTRLKIAAGAARGLTFIHTSCKALKLTHGNIKSTNILLDKSGDARVSDFGLALLAPPSSVNKSNGYLAPELSTTDGRRNTQRSDVYSFGVLLLEILTGKCPLAVDCGGGPGNGAVDLPRWVQSVVREEWTAEVFDLELMRYKDIEEEMVGLLQVAMACTCPSPDQRPKMSHVVKMIEEIRGVEVSPSHDNFDSVSDSPSLSEDTCGATSQ